METTSPERMRVVHALAELVCEQGLEGATVESVARIAGTSPRRFHSLFADIDDCADAGSVVALQRAAARVRAAARATPTRPGAALDELAGYIEEETELVALCMARLSARINDRATQAALCH